MQDKRGSLIVADLLHKILLIVADLLYLSKYKKNHCDIYQSKFISLISYLEFEVVFFVCNYHFCVDGFLGTFRDGARIP